MVNSPLIRPYFLGGGGIGGVPLDSHENCWDKNQATKTQTQRRGIVGPVKSQLINGWLFCCFFLLVLMMHDE